MPSQVAVANVAKVTPVLASDEGRPSREHFVLVAHIDQLDLSQCPRLVLVPGIPEQLDGGRIGVGRAVPEDGLSRRWSYAVGPSGRARCPK